MNSFAGIFIGICMGALKVSVEYDLYKSKKNPYNWLGAIIVTAILCFVYIVSGYDWKVTAITWLSYWNGFQLTNNWSHSQEIFYVWKIGWFNKFLIWLASAKWLIKFSFDESRIKFILHIITIVIIIILYHQ